MTHLTNYDPNGLDSGAIVSKQIYLATKMSARVGKSYKSYKEHGIKSPIFVASATSGALSGAALILISSCHLLRNKNLNFLVHPLSVASSGLSTFSDTLDGKLSIGSIFL